MDVLFPVTERAVASVVYASERRTPLVTSRRSGPPSAEVFQAAIETDLENAHRAARDVLNFKRKDIVIDLHGVLKTPSFEYRVSVDIDPEDASSALWHREIAFTAGSEVAEDVLVAFKDLLDTVLVRFTEPLDVAAIVDRLESREGEPVSVDYDMRCRWCEVAVAGVPATVRLEGREMRVVPNAGTAVPVAELWNLVRKGAFSG